MPLLFACREGAAGLGRKQMVPAQEDAHPSLSLRCAEILRGPDVRLGQSDAGKNPHSCCFYLSAVKH